MMKQIWFCERCATLGIVVAEEKADVMSVVHAMGQQQQEGTPDCAAGILSLRNVVPQNIQKSQIIHRFSLA